MEAIWKKKKKNQDLTPASPPSLTYSHSSNEMNNQQEAQFSLCLSHNSLYKCAW